MSADNLEFTIVPRFYITSFYAKKENFTEIYQSLQNLIEKRGYTASCSVHELDEFVYREYKNLGYLKIELNTLKMPAPDPATLFDVTQDIEAFCNDWNDKNAKHILLDVLNPPYAVNIGIEVGNTESIDPATMWTQENVLKFKQSLGRWVEFYSGQWPDYSKKLYLSRVSNNLSNRLSEVHFIRTNSAFIFMPEAGFDRFMPYMNTYFIEQILRVRALLYSYYLLNDEIDEIDENFPVLKEKPLKEIEAEIERVEDLDRLIQSLASRIFAERIMNRRAHSKKVLNTCYDLFQIELTSTTIESKVNRLRQTLSSERAANQEKLAQQQKRWILVLNVLLGSQIIFTLRDRIVEQFELTGTPLEELMNNGLIGLVAVIVVVAVGGLVYTWLSKRVDFGKLFQQEK